MDKDALPKVRSKLRAARKLVPDVQARIRLKQGVGDVRNGRELLKGLDDRLEEAVTLVEEMLGSAPAPAPEPEPVPPTIPGPWPPSLPPPPDPSKVTSGKTYSGGKADDGAFLSLGGLKNHVFTKNRFIESERRIVKNDCGRGVLLSDSFIDNLKGQGEHGAHCIYPGENWQTSDDVYEFTCAGLEFGKNNDLEDEFEIKGSNVYVIGCQGPFSVRIRHGVGTIVANNPECWNVSVRCGPHWVGGMPKAKVILYAGNLDGRKGHWEPDSGAPDVHVPAGGHNMQSAVDGSVWGVNEVIHGFSFGANDRKYPPTGCIIDPALQGRTKIIAGKPAFQAVKLPQLKAARALESIRARMTRDVAEAPAAERNREHEVYEWFLEANVNALRQAGVP